MGVKEYNWWSEANHGIQYDGSVKVTQFPQVIGIASSFNMSAVKEFARVASIEGRALANNGLYGLTYFAPNINIFRDPRWGRGGETPGECTTLTSLYAQAFVEGFQEGDDPKCLRAAATCKHAFAYSLGM